MPGSDQPLASDLTIADLLDLESRRKRTTLMLVASASPVLPEVAGAVGSSLISSTTEGYPGARYHGGARYVDLIEERAIDAATRTFAARHANVQPHSGSSANFAVMHAVLEPGDTIVGMDLAAGGHLTHGARVSMSGRLFDALTYGVGPDGWIDYDEVARTVRRHRPRLVIAGASSYPRTIDFARFRRIADEVGAYLLADVSHIAGLIAAGLHPSSVDHAHFTTFSTYKQLNGPRGGVVLLGRDATTTLDGRTLAARLDKAVFPGIQGTPDLGNVAGKAVALEWAGSSEFRRRVRACRDAARVFAAELDACGYTLVTGGTDNHIVMLDTTPLGISGLVAERALERCGIVANRNVIPGDRRPTGRTSGVRFGLNTVGHLGLDVDAVRECARLVSTVLAATTSDDDRTPVVDGLLAARIRQQVAEMVERPLCAAAV